MHISLTSSYISSNIQYYFQDFKMISIEQWRGQIGSFHCPLPHDEDEEAERLWRFMNKETPTYSERYNMNCGCSEDDLVKRGVHKSVIEDELIKGGIEPNPGPGPYEMVSLLNNMRVCS